MNRPPRVCILLDSFHPVVGGGETHARLLGRELVRLGAEVQVVTRHRVRASPRQEVLDGMRVTRVGPPGFRRWGKYLFLPFAARALRRMRDDFDLIYVCAFRVVGWTGVRSGLRLGKPVVLRAEACGEWSGAFVTHRPCPPGAKPAAWVRPLIRLRNRVFQRADRFLAVSQVIEQEYIEGGLPADRIARIPNGVDTKVFRPRPPQETGPLRRDLGLPAGRLVMCAGKLIRGKGLERLLRVWKDLAEDLPEVRLVLVGSGANQHLSCEHELRAYVARHRMGDRVVFAGSTTRVADYLACADLFVLPSESESFSLAVLEAMACGVAVVCSKIPGPMDFVRDQINGRLVPVEDEAAWRQVILEAVHNPLLARAWAAEGLATVQRDYTMPAIARRHLELFQSLGPTLAP